MHKFASTLFCNSLYLQFDSFAYARSVQLCKKRSKKEEADQILAIFFCQIYFWQTEPLWLMVIGQKTASAILQGSRYNWRTCRAHGRTKILNLIFAPINLQFTVRALDLNRSWTWTIHKVRTLQQKLLK